jgi:hypothetical protein
MLGLGGVGEGELWWGVVLGRRLNCQEVMGDRMGGRGRGRCGGGAGG